MSEKIDLVQTIVPASKFVFYQSLYIKHHRYFLTKSFPKLHYSQQYII